MVLWAYNGGMDIASTSTARMGRVIEHLFLLLVCRGEAVACDHNGVASFELVRHDRVCQELAARLLRFNDLAICPCRRSPYSTKV